MRPLAKNEGLFVMRLFSGSRHAGGMKLPLLPAANGRGSATERACWVSMPAECAGAEKFPELETHSDWLDTRLAGEMKDLEIPGA